MDNTKILDATNLKFLIRCVSLPNDRLGVINAEANDELNKIFAVLESNGYKVKIDDEE